MIHPAKNPQPNGFDLATFAPSLDAEAGESLGEFLSHFEDTMCDECDSGVSESDLMDRLKEALDQRDALKSVLDAILVQAPEVPPRGNRVTIHAGSIAAARAVVNQVYNLN